MNSFKYKFDWSQSKAFFYAVLSAPLERKSPFFFSMTKQAKHRMKSF